MKQRSLTPVSQSFANALKRFLKIWSLIALFLFSMIVASLPSDSDAAELPTVPIGGTTYGKAADAAQTAFSIQTGIDADVRRFREWGEAEAKRYGTKLGIMDAASVVGVVARAYRDKTLSFPVSRRCRLTLQTNQIVVSLTF